MNMAQVLSPPARLTTAKIADLEFRNPKCAMESIEGIWNFGFVIARRVPSTIQVDRGAAPVVPDAAPSGFLRIN
jgi:hypothetical protein